LRSWPARSKAIRGAFLKLKQTPTARKPFDLYVQSAADSGFTAAGGTPAICAADPVGGNAHSPNGLVRIDSLVSRTQAMARAILRLEAARMQRAASRQGIRRRRRVQ
jgi:glutamate carboxypeptidase